MMQTGLLDWEIRSRQLDEDRDPLSKLQKMVYWGRFRAELERVWEQERKSNAEPPSFLSFYLLKRLRVYLDLLFDFCGSIEVFLQDLANCLSDQLLDPLCQLDAPHALDALHFHFYLSIFNGHCNLFQDSPPLGSGHFSQNQFNRS